MMTSPLPVMACKLWAYSSPLRSYGSLTCHTCCDTKKPPVLQSHLNSHLVRQGLLGTDSTRILNRSHRNYNVSLHFSATIHNSNQLTVHVRGKVFRAVTCHLFSIPLFHVKKNLNINSIAGYFTRVQTLFEKTMGMSRTILLKNGSIFIKTRNKFLHHDI